MKKALLVSVDFLENTEEKNIEIFLKKVKEINFVVAFYSRDSERLKPYMHLNNKDNYIYLKTRREVNDVIKSNDRSLFTVIGSKDKDFEMAVNNKLLFIAPTWFKTREIKAMKYGINTTFQHLIHFIESISNQNNWFSYIKLPDNTYVLSLTDARYFKARKDSPKESMVSKSIEDVLKRGYLYYYNVYLYHCLASMSNTSNLFNDINHWCIVPSSSGKFLGNEMFNFKEIVRIMMKGQPLRSEQYKINPNLVLRHTPRSKTHGNISAPDRKKYGCELHLPYMCLNPAYKGKIKGKNICVFDDYLTHGNSFETVRNLLRNAGANKIVFVTVGTFMYDYQYQNYKLTGDIFSSNFKSELINRLVIDRNNFLINETAKKEVENLYNIFNL